MKFEINEVLKKLEYLTERGKNRRCIYISSLFKNSDFKEWLFLPPKDDSSLSSKIDKLYLYLTDKTALKTIISVVNNEGAEEFDRTTAMFLCSISNYAQKAAADHMDDIIKQRKDGQMSESKYKFHRNETEDYMDIAQDIMKLSKSITRSGAKQLSRKTGIPKKLCTFCLCNTPNTKYMDKYKLSVYLNNILTYTYQFAEDNSDDMYNLFKKNSDSKWTTFFEYIFGEKNLTDIASYILLEGLYRKSRYSSRSVTECWDSLTRWALNQLEESPDNTRDQMIELYIKRIANMFNNKSVDLRVNLLELAKDIYPRLTKTISKYEDKIRPIITRTERR